VSTAIGSPLSFRATQAGFEAISSRVNGFTVTLASTASPAVRAA
jgi:hypothetical protein